MVAGSVAAESSGERGNRSAGTAVRAGQKLEDAARAIGEKPHKLIAFLLTHSHLVPLDSDLTAEQARLINVGYRLPGPAAGRPPGTGTPAAADSTPSPLTTPNHVAAGRPQGTWQPAATSGPPSASPPGILGTIGRIAGALGLARPSQQASPDWTESRHACPPAVAAATPLPQRPSRETPIATQAERVIPQAAAAAPPSQLHCIEGPPPTHLDRERMSFQNWRNQEMARITRERRLLDNRAAELTRREARLPLCEALVEVDAAEGEASPSNLEDTESARRKVLRMLADLCDREDRLQRVCDIISAHGLRRDPECNPEGGVATALIADLFDADATCPALSEEGFVPELGDVRPEVCPYCCSHLLEGDSGEGDLWDEDDQDIADDLEGPNDGRGMRPSMETAIRLAQDAELALEDVARARAELAREKNDFLWTAERQSLELELLLAQAGELVDRCQEQLARLRAESRAEIVRPRLPSATELTWELLPPGKWTLDDILRHYRRYEGAEAGRRVDFQRIRDLQRLHPRTCYIGKKGWDGYFVMTFSHTERVVLDRPLEGNAIYVLPRSWSRWQGSPSTNCASGSHVWSSRLSTRPTGCAASAKHTPRCRA